MGSGTRFQYACGRPIPHRAVVTAGDWHYGNKCGLNEYPGGPDLPDLRAGFSTDKVPVRAINVAGHSRLYSQHRASS